MASCVFFIFSLLILTPYIFLHVEALADDAKNCPPAKCGVGGPEIRFPFRLKGLQPRECGRRGFQLVCKENSTMIQLPSYGDLVIQSISYETQKLDLVDPKSCVHEVFMNLNLSLTPFRYSHHVKNYTYVNCSVQLSSPNSFPQVPCLSSSQYHVYTVESSSMASCMPMKTVAIPFPYSPYISDNTFGLSLTWTLPGCSNNNRDHKAKRQTSCFKTGFSNKHLVIIAGVMVTGMSVGLLISMKIRNSMKQENGNNLQKSFRDYEALKSSSAEFKG